MSASETPVKLTIGLPICNEEKTLEQFFPQLEKAIADLPPNVTVETIACLNGCTDRSADIVQKIAAEPIGKRIHLTVIPSRKGKLNAQLEIVQKRTHDGPICFMDTDTLPGKNTLSALLATLQSDPACYTAFARVEPFYDPATDGKRTRFQESLKTQYALREFSPPKKYIHGRAFMLRDDKELRGLQDDIEKRIARIPEKSLVETLNLTAGPLVDDIYLSRAIAHKHGLESIREVPGTQVYFHPPEHEEDLFAAIKRTSTEIKRLNLLYPEFQHLEKDLCRKELGHAALPVSAPPELVEKAKYVNDLELKFWEANKFQLGLVLMAGTMDESFLQRDLWISAPSTKRAFDRHPLTEVLPPDTLIPPEKITSVLVVPFTQDGKVVAVKNNRGWDLPGGHVEQTDSNIEATARREAREEAKITLRRLKRSNVIKFRGETMHDDTYMVVMTGMVDKMSDFIPDKEIKAREILSPEEFIKKYTAGNKEQMEAIIAKAQIEAGTIPRPTGKKY